MFSKGKKNKETKRNNPKESSGPFSSMTSSLPKNLFSGRSRKSSGGYVIADCGPQFSSSPKNGQAVSSSEMISRSQTLGNSPVHSYYFEGGMNHSDSNPVSSIHGSAYSSPSNTSLTACSHASLFNSPTNTAGKSNTLSNVRALRDRYDNESSQHYSEQVVERQVDTLQMSQNEQTRSNPSISPGNLHNFSLSSSVGRDRSTDREYPHMGARSLERDHHYTGRSRSMERADYTTQLYNQEMRNFRDSFILDLQSQVADLSKECAKLHQELDSTKDKLSSSMNSIKTFWSPELKKERALRKEESAKYCLLHEQLKVSQAELKKQSSIIQSLENQVSLDQDVQASTQISQQEIEILHREKDKQSKEILILRKTIDEMELRIDSQKQTLAARDESMKKLLEMLQNKGHSIQEIEDHRHEMENLQTQRLEDERKIKHLQNELSHQQSEMGLLKEGRNRLSDELKQVNLQLKQQPASIHTMKAMMEAKDSRISALEKDIQILEDRLIKSQESGSESCAKKEPAGKDSLTNVEKVLRAEAENLKKEVSTKETELEGLNLKVETMTSQQSENQQYISVLKEQVTAKDKQMSMLQSEIDEIREKLKEKNSTIDRKDQKSHTLQTEKRKIETEITELKDQIDAKDRKLTLLQRKVDALEEDVKEKDASITQLKASQTHMENATSAMTALEETITEKDKQIERLKEQRDRAESEHQEECDLYIKKNQDIKIEMDKLQLELTDKQTELCELREKVTEAASEKFELDKQMQERLEEMNSVKTEFEKIKNEKEESKNAKDFQKKIEELDFQVQKGHEETTTALKMVEQLQETVKEMEEEKTVKNQELEDMQEIIKEYKQKMGTLKRSKEIEKKKNAHLLEEARKREGDLSEDASQLKDAVIAKGDRIEELEEALKESVRITAEREMVMIEQQQQLEEAEAKVAELTMELARNKTTENSAKVNFLTKQLEEKELKLKRLQSERHKHLEEVYEMKQEAIQAAMSEKDANIALLEMTSTKQRRNTDEIEKLNKEKEKLQQQLKEVTQNRMKLIQKQERRSESLGRSKKSPSHKSKGCSPDRVNPYVLTAPASLDS